MLESLPDIITDFVIILLALGTVRDIIAFLGLVPVDSKFARLVYGKYDRIILIRALEELGYNNRQAKDTAESLTYNEIYGKHSELLKKNAPKYLLSILVNHTYKINGTFGGEDDKYLSNYYVNTMEAVHEKEHNHLEWLKDLLSILIINDNKKSDNKEIADFIIAPKSGNPILAYALARHMDLPLLLVKHKKEKSSVKLYVENKEGTGRINIEGADYLYRLYKNSNKSTKLRGIMIDCNTTRGTQILSAMSELNKIAGDFIEPIKDVYVLFRIVDEIYNIDEKFEEQSCRLVRYFDLTEELKADLYSLKGEYDNTYFDYYLMKDKKNLDKYLENLNNLGNLKYKIME